MGLFGSNKAYELPPGDPISWTATDVKHWIKHIGMAKHKAAFRVLSGQELMTLTDQDVHVMCKQQDLDAKYIWRMLLRVRGEPEPAKVAPAVAAKERAIQYLFQWAGEDASIADFREFLDGAGTVTVGLMTASERMAENTIGVIVGLVFKIYKGSRDAQVNIYNCRILRYLCVDVLRAFHSAGTERLGSVDGTAFDGVQEQLERALMLVRSCSKPGWLVRMAFAGRIDDEFAAIHSSIVDLLQESGLDDLYGHAKLPRNGDYTDCCESLQTVLDGQADDVREALTIFSETGQGYESIKTALSCDDEGLRSEMGYIGPALAVIDKMLPKGPPTPPPSTAPPPAPPSPEPTEEELSRRSTEELDHSEHTDGREHSAADLLESVDEPSATEMINNYSVEAEGNQEDEDGQDGEPGPMNMYETFIVFCNFGTRQETCEMDGSHFSKFCRDTGLVGKGLTATDVDLVFARVKPKGQRRIVYEEFVEALTLLANRSQMPLKDLTEKVLAAGGPAVKATAAGYNRFHDDKSLYTGVYARGGPTNIDDRITLDKMVMRPDPVSSTPRMTPRMTPRGAGTWNTSTTPRMQSARPSGRTPRLVPNASAEPSRTTPRLIKHQQHQQPASSATPRGTSSKSSSPGSVPRIPRSMATTPRAAGARTPLVRPATARAPRQAAGADMAVPWQDPDSRAELLRVYTAFATFGHFNQHKAGGGGGLPAGQEMENKQFVKLVKDAGLLGGGLTVTRLDIIFSKVKAKGRRKITFAGFERALTLLADEKGFTLAQTYNAVVSTAGPQLNDVTTPEFVKYHDDRSTYTGVYARGGPTKIDKRITLESMVTRNDDVYHNSRTPRFVA